MNPFTFSDLTLEREHEQTSDSTCSSLEIKKEETSFVATSRPVSGVPSSSSESNRSMTTAVKNEQFDELFAMPAAPAPVSQKKKRSRTVRIKTF